MTEAALSWRTRRDNNNEFPRMQQQQQQQTRRRDRTPKSKGEQMRIHHQHYENHHHHQHNNHHYYQQHRDRVHTPKNFQNPGISQNIDRMDRDTNRRQTNGELINGPKPVFQNNTKKSSHVNKQQEVVSPQHEELVRFLSESWEEVRKEAEESDKSETSNGSSSSTSCIYYQLPEPVECLRDFKPFDFEAWWGRRLYNSITKSVP